MARDTQGSTGGEAPNTPRGSRPSSPNPPRSPTHLPPPPNINPPSTQPLQQQPFFTMTQDVLDQLSKSKEETPKFQPIVPGHSGSFFTFGKRDCLFGIVALFALCFQKQSLFSSMPFAAGIDWSAGQSSASCDDMRWRRSMQCTRPRDNGHWPISAVDRTVCLDGATKFGHFVRQCWTRCPTASGWWS